MTLTLSDKGVVMKIKKNTPSIKFKPQSSNLEWIKYELSMHLY